MAIVRPPITGDVVLDSWMDQVCVLLDNKADAAAVADIAASVSVIDPGDTGGGGGADGVSAATIVLYKRSENNPLPPGDDITSTVVYTYSSGQISPAQPDGWTREYPPLIDGNYVYAIQVNIADTNPTETIPAGAWSAPTLIAAADDNIQVRVASNNGTALRPGTINNTTLKAVVSRNGNDQDDIAHNGYDYKWTVPSGQVICVDASRNVINDGESPLLATGTEGSLVCAIGTPADSTEANDIHGSTLREITFGPEDVDKAQAVELQVSNIPD